MTANKKSKTLRISVADLASLADLLVKRGRDLAPRSMADSVDSSSSGYSTRRHPSIAQGTISGPYTRRQWLQAILQGNALMDNGGPARTAASQAAIQAVSYGPAVMVGLDNDPDNAAGLALSKALERWAKSCHWQAVDGMTLQHIVYLAAIELQVAGTFLVAFDDFVIDNGKVMAFASEQYAHMSPSAWASFTTSRKLSFFNPITGKTSAGKLANGRVYNDSGQVVGYCVDMAKTFADESKADSCMFIPKESAFEFSIPHKSYGDPIGGLSSVYNQAMDASELRGAQIETAKNEAQLTFCASGGKAPVSIEVANGGNIDDMQVEELGKILEQTGSVPDDVAQAVTERTGVKCVAVPKDGKLEVIESKKPSAQIQAHYDATCRETGIAIGIYSTLAMGRADASYSAARGEMVLTWSWLYKIQGVLDLGLSFLQAKYISWGVRTGSIEDPAKIDPDWAEKIENIWPEMPSIDPEKEINAQVKGLENCIINYSDIHHARWRQKFSQRKTEYSAYRDNQVPNRIYESTPGAVGTGPQTQPKQ